MPTDPAPDAAGEDLPALRIATTVLLHNGIDTIADVLKAVADQTRPPDLVVVVDNDSTDDGERELAAFPDVHVVRAPENVGVGGGHNLGWSEARRLDAHVDALWSLEHDSIPDPTCLAELAAELEHDPSRPRVAMPRQVTDLVLDTSELDGPPVHIRKNLTFNGLLIPVSAIDDVGMIDPEYFVGFEDRDLAHRLRDHGWEIVRVSAARIGHANKGKHQHLTPDREYYGTRNQLHFVLRVRHSRLRAARLLVRSVLRIAADAVTPARRRAGHTRARWEGLRDGLQDRRGPRP